MVAVQQQQAKRGEVVAHLLVVYNLGNVTLSVRECVRLVYAVYHSWQRYIPLSNASSARWLAGLYLGLAWCLVWGLSGVRPPK